MRTINIVLSAMTLFIQISCSPNSKDDQHAKSHQGHEKHNHANHHMNQTSFEDLVERFESDDRALWQKPDTVIAFLGDLKNKTVIDIGAGTGYLEFKIKEPSCKLIAADVDQRFIDYMNKRIEETGVKNISTRKAEFDKPPVEKDEADIVFMIDVYHHIENRTNYFREVKKALKEKGELVIVDFKKGDFEHGPPNEMKMSAEEIILELKKSGFILIKRNETSLDYQYMLKFK
jgi:ubiquinone/menaquinone biosynthesis C-methylase UbiE